MSGKLKQQDIPPAEDLSDLGAPPAPPRGSGLSELLGAATPTARRQRSRKPAPKPSRQCVRMIRLRQLARLGLRVSRVRARAPGQPRRCT